MSSFTLLNKMGIPYRCVWTERDKQLRKEELQKGRASLLSASCTTVPTVHTTLPRVYCSWSIFRHILQRSHILQYTIQSPLMKVNILLLIMFFQAGKSHTHVHFVHLMLLKRVALKFICGLILARGLLNVLIARLDLLKMFISRIIFIFILEKNLILVPIAHFVVLITVVFVGTLKLIQEKSHMLVISVHIVLFEWAS